MKPQIILNYIIILFVVSCYIDANIINTKLYTEDLILCFLYLFIPIVISFLIYRRLTIIGFFIGFITQWIIFLNVNPYPVQNDNKIVIMSLVPEKYRPETQFLLTNIYSQKFKYPIIIKPIYCSGGSNDITIVDSKEELDKFIKEPKNVDGYMVQNFLKEYTVEIGVLWEKYPWQQNGKVIEIVEKTQKDHIRFFDHNNYLNHSNKINKKINEIINNISKIIPNMNVCRYDIRLKNIDDLEKDDFKIIEINGTMGMAYLGYPLHMGVFKDIKWYFTRLFIGLVNIVTLKGYSPMNLLIAMYKSYYSKIHCNIWENLYSLYS